MDAEIQLISDGDGFAVIGGPKAVEAFPVSEGLWSSTMVLGTRDTKTAFELGCLFSVNASMGVAELRAAGVPLEAILAETDHPSGNRTSSEPRQPCRTADVERPLAAAFLAAPVAVRTQTEPLLVYAATSTPCS